MKVTLIAVASLDGKTTRGASPGTAGWASAEDQVVFRAQIAAHDCVVMGSATYAAARQIIRPRADKPRIVLTRRPERFVQEKRPGLAFSKETPEALIKRLEASGYTSLLLVGGAQTNARFVDAGLVDELLVTIEPVMFGAGLPLTVTLKRNVPLRLVSHKRLNSQGTLLLHYAIQKPNQELLKP
ncbi:MAG TPA: dihydrofolate reductase family protein [Candidatus Saccharimonadales bacterium]|nr:dihydrofolate reductase family protein [Candidatus Saccharimonadales bacterium]